MLGHGTTICMRSICHIEEGKAKVDLPSEADFSKVERVIESEGMADFAVRPLDADDRDWVSRFIVEHWGADNVVAHGVVFYPQVLPASFEAG